MALQNLLYSHAHLRPHIFSTPPVCAGVISNCLNQLGRDDPQVLIAHHIYGAAVLRQGVIERPLLRGKAVFRFIAQVLRNVDEFLKNLKGINASVMILGGGLFQAR
jgi:hypothetical protein